jgi:hypothetical protein
LDQGRVLDIQSRNREHFEQAFARHLTVMGFKIDAEGNGFFQLGRWQEPDFLLRGTSQDHVCSLL